jgi:hypothetical protein
MVDLSIQFLGVCNDRLTHTTEVSKGLSLPVVTDDGLPAKSPFATKVPTMLFPLGRWKASKTPFAKKGKVGNLNRASIGEVVFTDNFESGDVKQKYGKSSLLL